MLLVFLVGVARADFNPPPLGDPVYIAPPVAGVAPLILPALPGLAPPSDTTPVPVSPPDLPVGLPAFSGLAETTAVNLAAAFIANHPAVQLNVHDSVVGGMFNVTVTGRDAGDFFSYMVNETALTVSPTFVMRDGLHSEILAAGEHPISLDGGLAYALFDNSLLTAMIVHSEIGGIDTTWQYPQVIPLPMPPTGGGASPGLSSPEALSTLQGLIVANLNGPANGLVLATFQQSVDDYFNLTVPEPSTLILAASLVPLILLWRRRLAAEHDCQGGSTRRGAS